MDVHGGVAAVVEDHVRVTAAVPVEHPGGVVPVFGERLALDGEHRNAGSCDRRGRMILRRIDVAGDPADVGAERCQRLDQHTGLDRHVQRACDTRALQRLFGAVLLARRHQARHLGLGQREFLAAEFGERNVLDDVVGEGGLLGGGGHDGFLFGDANVAVRRRNWTLCGTLCSLAPLLRGEGWGEGLYPHVELVEIPFTRRSRRPLPASGAR